jgi:DNA-directed RNA polymerase subunit RPC12/RpoP
MSRALRDVIEEARTEGDYRCAHCEYAMGDVPLKDDLVITCPECGYDMVFEVKVRLRPREPNFDRIVRGRLHRIEVVLMIVVIGLVVTAVGIGIIIMAVIGS